jgi:uncharacterized membrane protein
LFWLYQVGVVLMKMDENRNQQAAERIRVEERKRSDAQDVERKQREKAAVETQIKNLLDEGRRAPLTGATQGVLLQHFNSWLGMRQTEMYPDVVTVTVKNVCRTPVSFAIRFKMPDSSNRWMTMGWWTVPPNESVSPTMATADRTVYFWSDDGAPSWAVSKTAPASVVGDRFVQVDGVESEGSNKRTVSMSGKTFDASGNQTVQFGCSQP